MKSIISVTFNRLILSSQTRFTDAEPFDTSQPQDILEEEELDRISGLLQRDNLVRGLGVVEHVYRLLHCTPGTIGVMKNAERQPNVSHQLDQVQHKARSLFLILLFNLLIYLVIFSS